MRKHDKFLISELRRHFKIDNRGRLVRRVYMSSNAPAGQIVKGSRHSKGYRVLGFKNKTYFVHRVIYAVKNGKFPAMLDHVNGKRDDNRLENLRESSPLQNQRNRRLSNLNKSGCRGVYFYDKKWRAQLRINLKRYNLGAYETKEKAIEAIRKFERSM